MSRTRWAPRTAPVTLLAALLFTLWLPLLGCAEPQAAYRGTQVEDPAPAPPLVGTDWNGEPFRLEETRGKVAVVFFGYTYCPDICPFTLAKMKQLYARLGDRADQVAMVFVSVDPHRDSVEKLASYVPNFDRRFHGVHLSFPQLDDVKEDWDITVQYGQPKEGPGTDSFYYVDHTGSFFLIDREGRWVVTHGPKASVDDLVADVESLLDTA